MDNGLVNQLKALTQNLNEIKEQQSVMNRKLDKIEETQEQHTESLINIETTNKVYGDMYKMNDDNVRKIEKRVEKLEKKSGIEPSPDLMLVDIQ